MATRIRLQRHGKKGKAFFHLVAADSRAKRDGKYIEKLGTYNPNTNPATIEINFDKTLSWVQTGAEMSDTARAILSYKGILYKNHLIKGVGKGALTLEQVEAKFAEWQAQKDARISGKKDMLSKKSDLDKAAKMKAEIASNEAKAKEIEAKNNAVDEVIEQDEDVVAETPEVTPEVSTDDSPSADLENEDTNEEISENSAINEQAENEEAVEAVESSTDEQTPDESASDEAVAEEPSTNEPQVNEDSTEEVAPEE